MRHLDFGPAAKVVAMEIVRREVVGVVGLLRSKATDPPVAQGIALACLTALISGVSVFVNSYAVREFSSPTAFATLKNTIVGIALLAVVLRPPTFEQVRHLTARRGLGLVLLGVVGGSIPFVLFFEGLSLIGPGNTAFIHKTLFLWVAGLAVVFSQERLSKGHLTALGMLLLAQLLLGAPGAFGLNLGVALVLAATLLWAVETTIAKRVLGGLGSRISATGRMAAGAAILLAYLALTGRIDSIWDLTALQWMWGFGTSLLLLSYVLSWYAALKRAPATTVTCVLTVGAPITAILSAVAGMGLPRLEQIAGYGVLALAICLFVLIGAPGSLPATLSRAPAGAGGR